MMLHELLQASARSVPDRPAVADPERGVRLTYGAFDTLTDGLRDRLLDLGVSIGDRVGIYGPKSVGTLAAIFGALKAGAAYVPIDPDAPPHRNAYILRDCAVSALIVEKSRWERLLEHGGDLPFGSPRLLAELDGYGIEFFLVGLDERVVEAEHADGAARPDLGADLGTLPRAERPPSDTSRLAYILYTSGSTGNPKGVMHTHASALSFVDWCSREFEPTEHDCFSSHAPFHFDLSILDIYVAIKHGAQLVLIGEDLGKQPKALADVIARERISMWYSTPSILRLLLEYGDLSRHDFSALRVVNFAGEVFPIAHLRALMAGWPHPRYYNLYGPTETNVCTYYAVRGTIPDDRLEPLSIGIACSDDVLKIVDEDGRAVPNGEEGELLVSGGSVMAGYWNLPDRTDAAFAIDEQGMRWYRTGDVVREEADGNLTFLGRRDRMVKRRGYRVELGEIEAALYRHPSVREAAVVAIPHEESGVMIMAFLAWGGAGNPSIIQLKQFSAGNLPLYMIPDRFVFLSTLPKTSTDKIDYQHLMRLEA